MIGSIVRQIDVDIILITNGFAAAIIGMRLPLFETKITTLSLRALIDHNFVIMNNLTATRLEFLMLKCLHYLSIYLAFIVHNGRS